VALAIRERTETTLSEINVTPLVDVVLVLLIIFMITAPMMSASVEVHLPQASIAPPPSAKEHLVVTVAADGRIYVGESLTDLDLVPNRVKEKLRATGLSQVAIRGDKAVSYGLVLQVLDRIRLAEVRNVGLVMNPPENRPRGAGR
jgi:biopolymer transport protein TolR